MKSNVIDSINLETHDTKSIEDNHINGSLTVIWRDWDKILNFTPKMVYVSSVNPGEKKGPHLHLKRDSYFVCIQGKVVFVIKDDSSQYHEIESSAVNPVMVQVPKNFPSAHVNLTNSTSTILTLTNLAWRPDDNEMKNVTFDDYDWNKWK